MIKHLEANERREFRACLGRVGRGPIAAMVKSQLSEPVAPSLVTPVLFRLPFDRWRCWVLALEPVLDQAGAIGGTESLRDDALAAERAGVLEDGYAITVIMNVEHDAVTLLAQYVG